MRRFTILLLVLLLLTVPVSGQFKPPSSIDVQAKPQRECSVILTKRYSLLKTWRSCL